MPPDEHGLVFYPDSRPGIRRQRCGRGFTYVAPDGTRVPAGPERDRLVALAVPPAYECVWLCPLPNGHLQATGRDVRGRKQYRYHEAWSAARAETKFASLADFGRCLPSLRRRVARDLDTDAGDRSFALAAAVRLIDRLCLRVGNRRYAQLNGSYGVLTLRPRHVRLKDGQISISYTSKGGRKVRRRLSDRALARVLEKARDLPGAELLSWVDEEGTPHRIDSAELNRYIAEAGGGEGFTAKTFRTWAGTLAAFRLVDGGAEPTLTEMAEAAAVVLGNTPRIARASYIHPAVAALAESGGRTLPSPKRRRAGLSAAENRLLAFLETA